MTAGVVPGSSVQVGKMPLYFLTINLGLWQALQKPLNLREPKGHSKQCSMDKSEVLTGTKYHFSALDTQKEDRLFLHEMDR
jgi:hypothetical protein